MDSLKHSKYVSFNFSEKSTGGTLGVQDNVF